MKTGKKQKSSITTLACIIILSAAPAEFSGCKQHSSLSSYAISDVPYGKDRENTMDISLPEGRTDTTPVIILIHGGAWTGGDKKDMTFMRGYFSDRGFAAVSVNYRLARIKGAGLRNILDDMDSIIAYVKEKSRYLTFSRDVIFLAGHSAGGHIALLYSFTRAPERVVRGVISYCGLSDLTDPELETSLKRMQENENGHTGKQFDRIGFLTGPDRNMRALYSPIFNTRDIPVLLFCGKLDDVIPWSQSENLYKKMKERGFDSTLYVYPDMGHDITPYYGVIMKINEKWIRDRTGSDNRP